MQFRRHMPPLREWKLPQLSRRLATRWGAWGIGALLAGYLTAYLLIFPTPILHGRQVVPRVLGLSLQEASQQIRTAGFEVHEGGSEPHPTAPAGTVIWQDPPPGVNAPAGLRVTLVVSAGPPKIPVPDVAGLDGSLAQRLVTAAGLTVAQVESVQAPTPTGIAIQTQPGAGSLLPPAAGVTVVVSRGAPTIAVPVLLGMSVADARTRLEADGLKVGSVTRRRTAEGNPGTVVGQKPAAGTLAAPGTVVDLIVARSPQ
jgi:serine/threonine-protein kinase